MIGFLTDPLARFQISSEFIILSWGVGAVPEDRLENCKRRRACSHRSALAKCQWHPKDHMIHRLVLALSLIGLSCIASAAWAEPPLDGREGRDLLLRLYRPESTLRVSEHKLTRAKFPVVDVHTHFRVRLKQSPEQRDEFVKLMDRNQIALCSSLD